MKKVFYLLVSLFFLTSLTSCSRNEEDNKSKVSSKLETMSSEVESKNSKTLVVFYSASGNTKKLAEKISDKLSADLFEIRPKEAYTKDDLDFTKADSRVSLEHEDESKRDIELVENTPSRWQDYDTIYIGYPIWWAIAAWPVDSFVKNNDFTNKKIITFCTSQSSGLGDSTNILEKMAKGGSWTSGRRFSQDLDDKEIDEWVKSL